MNEKPSRHFRATPNWDFRSHGPESNHKEAGAKDVTISHWHQALIFTLAHFILQSSLSADNVSPVLHSVFILETGSCSVVQAVLKLTILLPQPLECWDYRCAHCTGFNQCLQRRLKLREVQQLAQSFPANLGLQASEKYLPMSVSTVGISESLGSLKVIYDQKGGKKQI